MQITIQLDTADVADLTALSALVASLGDPFPPLGGGSEKTPVGAQAEADFREKFFEAQATMASPSEALMAAAARAAPPAAAATVDLTKLDASGVPWDARIHSSAQSINESDGMWRKRRGINEVEFGRVHAELQALHAQVAPNDQPGTGIAQTGTDGQPSNIAPPPPAVPTVPAAPPAPAQAEAPAAPLAPPVPSAPMADVPAAPLPAESAQGAGEARWPTWAAFVAAVSGLVGTGDGVFSTLNEKATLIGLDRWALLKDQPDKWADFWAMLGGE